MLCEWVGGAVPRQAIDNGRVRCDKFEKVASLQLRGDNVERRRHGCDIVRAARALYKCGVCRLVVL